MQVEHEFNPSSFLKIVADSIESLRRSDVYRLLDEAQSVNPRASKTGSPAIEMADYICENRIDLQDEVVDVMSEEFEMDTPYVVNGLKNDQQ